MPEDIKSVGTTLEHDGGSGTPIIHIRSLSGPDGDTVDINTTDYDVEDDFQTFIAGMSDAGEITVTAKFDDSEFGEIYDEVGETREWTMTFNTDQSTPPTLVFDGHLKMPSIEFEDAEDDGLVTMELTIKISGKPEFTAGTS